MRPAVPRRRPGCRDTHDVDDWRRPTQTLSPDKLTGTLRPWSAEAVVAIHHIAQPYLPQVMAALLVVSALGQFVPRIGAGHIGIEVGRIVSQETAADQLLLLPHTEKTNLGLFQLFLPDAVEAVPELLRVESLRRQVPKRTQDSAVIPAGYFGLGTRLTDAVDRGQQQIMRR